MKQVGPTNSVKGISELNNFEFTEAGIRVWCAYQIGPGSLMTYEGKPAQGETGMKLLQPFGTSPQLRNVCSGLHPYLSQEPRNEVFFCDAPSCVLTFRNANEAQDHMDTGTHQLVLERETVYDTIRRKWAQHDTGIVSRSAESSKKSARPPNLSSCSDDN